ncbi:hypothetical protein CTI12_AA188650 [Artemisia annua]|uniref:Calcineurin-like phosphoesterase domain-containing protein n=1 Tax=Artemisia annua TaxID=35608 RepID=A0A2U1NVE5_ARTAN|nr:hypothetical protein CTI12_AA188650 [Artemisia annua]
MYPRALLHAPPLFTQPPSFPASHPSKLNGGIRLSMSSSSVRIVVVGDTHDDWNLLEDSKALHLLKAGYFMHYLFLLELSGKVFVIFGDFGNENVELVRSIAALKFPKAAILGNHDAWNTQNFSANQIWCCLQAGYFMHYLFLLELSGKVFVIFGDFGNENVELVRSIAALKFPKAAILGNHDAWNTQNFSANIPIPTSRTRLEERCCPTPAGKMVKSALCGRETMFVLEEKVLAIRSKNHQNQLGDRRYGGGCNSFGEEHVGYKRLDFHSLKLSVIGGRPFSCGGERLFRKQLLAKRYGVHNMNESAKKISEAAVGTPKNHSIILLAHNGPTGVVNGEVGPTQAALRHNPGLAVEWGPDEQSLLEELLTKYASDSSVLRYAKIAKKLQDKTVRDVALRCRWMSEKVTEHLAKSSSHTTNRANGPPYAQSAVSMDSDDGISYKGSISSNVSKMCFPEVVCVASAAIGGVAEVYEKFFGSSDPTHLDKYQKLQVHENINLFCQARNNIVSILNDLNDMPEIMKQMPPLPVKLNEELTNSMLPHSSLQKKS